MNVYEAIYRRRDIRRFRHDPLPMKTLARLLHAAHHAPSVGFMQPWNFLIVEDIKVRKRVKAHVDRERIQAAEAFEGERREKYLSYKLDGILEAPVNLCVTCDRTRLGPAVLGRHTIPETDLYSTCCAVQNFWLAARAEGVGVGWVSILKMDELRSILGIPSHVVPVAYLCVGYADRFTDKPELETTGWQSRLPLTDLVYGDRWKSNPPESLLLALRETVSHTSGQEE